ncbi:protein FAM217B, partial [Ochotona princeps]|uniref:protein FAM217B n=1 Tax=Ochotona princeps TaxID=9978 RepID=UPI0027154B87
CREASGSSSLGAGCRDACGSTLFLVSESVTLRKEDAEEDSASDLSESERVPIPPSPLTPPHLELRAEDIDPRSFDLHLGQDQTKPEHAYPSFLPRPYSCWDLRNMASLLHAEHRAEAVPRVGGLLGRFLDRLLQLEWLQMQTVQCEKSKGGKVRLPPGPGAPGALKSPGRSKFLASALSKPPLHQEVASKSGPSRKKVFHREEVRPSCYAFEACLRPTDALGGTRLCSQEQKTQVKSEEKRKEPSQSARLQYWDVSCSGRSPKVEASGNIRIPRCSATTLDSADPCETPKTQTPANLKKKGNANNCGNATMSSEKKLRTNRAKQSTHRLKNR